MQRRGSRKGIAIPILRLWAFMVSYRANFTLPTPKEVTRASLTDKMLNKIEFHYNQHKVHCSSLARRHSARPRHNIYTRVEPVYLRLAMPIITAIRLRMISSKLQFIIHCHLSFHVMSSGTVSSKPLFSRDLE